MGAGASLWREDLVRPLLAVYAGIPDVAAVALSGSVARRSADRWSDVEVMVFWLCPPSAQERCEAAMRSRAGIERMFPFDPGERIWSDALSVGPDGLSVESSHLLVSSAEEHLHRLLDDCEPDPFLLNFAQGITDAVPAFGATLFDNWRNRLREYPEQLQLAAVRRSAQVDHFWRWKMLVDRRNPMLLAAATGEIASRLYSTVLALNKMYGPGLKSPDALSRPFEIAPHDFAARIRDSFAMEAAEQAAALTALISETYDLIDQHLPTANVERLREIFRYERTAAGPVG